MTGSEILDVIARLEVAYREEITDAERKLWVQELNEFRAAQVWVAVEAHIRSKQVWLPRVGEIIAAVVNAGRPTAEEAWEQVLAEVGRVGRYGVPEFPVTAVGRAVELIGWYRICDGDAASPWPFKDFDRVYDGVVSGQDRELANSAASRLLVSDDVRALVAGIGVSDEVVL